MSAAQLGARHRRGIDHLVLGPVLAPLVDDIDLDLPRRDDRPDGLEQVRPIELRRPRHAQDLEGIEPPRTGGHHPHQRDVVVRVGDRPERLLEVADLGRVEQAQPADDGVRDVLVPQPRDDGLAVAVLAVQDGDVGPARFPPVPSPTIDLMASTIATASSSAPAQTTSSTGVAVGSVGRQPLVGLEARPVVDDEPVRGGQHVPHRPEVLVDPEARRRTGRRRAGVVRGRPREPRIELGEGREAGAPEPVDRLVVVADDHDVVGPVGRPAEHLDQLDLGDVGVLELVDQDVAELALPAAQDVRAGLEQRRDAGDLLAVVERAAPRELGLVGPEDLGHLGQAQHLERRAIDDVGRREGIDPRVELRVDLVAPQQPSRPDDGPAGLAVGGLGERRLVVVGRLAARLRALVPSHPRVGAADRPQRREVALRGQPADGVIEAAVARLEHAPLLGDEGIERRPARPARPSPG